MSNTSSALDRIADSGGTPIGASILLILVAVGIAIGIQDMTGVGATILTTTWNVLLQIGLLGLAALLGARLVR